MYPPISKAKPSRFGSFKANTVSFIRKTSIPGFMPCKANLDAVCFLVVLHGNCLKHGCSKLWRILVVSSQNDE